MNAYSYDNQGLFQGPVERQYIEYEKRWGIPANATDKIPPEESGKVAVWNGKDWELKPDNRGLYYKTDNGKQTIINDPLSDISGLTKLVPSDESFPLWDGKKWKLDVKAKNEFDNNIIKQKLIEIDVKLIRPLAEINNPDIDSKEALKILKALEKEKQILRKQLK